MNTYTILRDTPLGDLLLVASDTHLLGIYFAEAKHAPKLPRVWHDDADHPVLVQTARELREYWAGQRTEFSIPVHFDGTPFQCAVWKEIAAIPFGQTISYSELAARTGKPAAIRAAGTATGANPISIVIPCHRVVGKDTKMHGYAGGLDRKRKLLVVEGLLL